MSKLEDTAYNYGAKVIFKDNEDPRITEVGRLLAQNDRLRGALERIAAEDFTITDDGVRLSGRIAGPFAKVALAALAKEAAE